jgi:hypothetical protein
MTGRFFRTFEDTILGHERHQCFDIVTVPRIGKGLQDLDGLAWVHLWRGLA